MTESSIRIYSVPFSPANNFCVDDIDRYLALLDPWYDNEHFQYIKLQLDLTIKVSKSQLTLTDSPYPNYVQIIENNRAFYYFVMSMEWKGQNTILLSLSMDTINTFKGLTFSAKTEIIREHQDRFLPASTVDSSFYALRKIDRYKEGVETQKHLTSLTSFPASSTSPAINSKWYVWYQTSEALTTDNLSNPVSCYLCSDASLPVGKLNYGSFSHTFRRYEDYALFELADNPNGKVNILPYNGGSSFTIVLGSTSLVSGTAYGGTQAIKTGIVKGVWFGVTPVAYPWCVIFDSNDEILWEFQPDSQVDNLCTCTFLVSSYWRLNGYNSDELSESLESYRSKPATPYIASENTQIVYTSTFSDLASLRTDSKNMKIIELPYCPVTSEYANNIWYFEGCSAGQKNGMLLKNATTQFLRDNIINEKTLDFEKCQIPPKDYRISYAPNIGLESKMYSSEFFEPKISYDSFELTIRPEDIVLHDIVSPTTPSFNVDFKFTSSINSVFAFKVHFRQIADYYVTSPDELYIVVKRNNEKTIFSNSYIDYIRTGYRYDLKANQMANFSNWLSTGLSVAGSAGSLAVGVATGNVISAAAGVASAVSVVNSIASNITAQADRENVMAKNLASLKAQASSVSGSDDIDILDWTGANCLRYSEYQTTPEMQAKLFDLFFYCGYAHPVQEVPNVTSRVRFNFLQCKAVFENEGVFAYQWTIDDIKSRFESGVTYIHHYPNTDELTSWDFAQSHENWETFLLS